MRQASPQVYAVFSQTGANSRVLETDGDDMVARDHECYFLRHAAKDSGIALAWQGTQRKRPSNTAASLTA